MVSFGDRQKIVEAYEKWLEENSTIKDCLFNLVTFMVMRDLVKDRTETDFYEEE